MYLLDTNVCIKLLNDQQPEIEKEFRSLSPSEIALCSIVKAELLFGARNSKRIDANLQRLHFFFAPLCKACHLMIYAQTNMDSFEQTYRHKVN